MSQVDELLILGRKIGEHFPRQIKEYFSKPENVGNNSAVLSTMKEEIVEAQWFSRLNESDAAQLRAHPFDLPLCVCFVLSSNPYSSPEQTNKIRRGFQESRRQKKAYRMRTISNEYKKGGGALLDQAYESYTSFQTFATEDMRTYTKEEFFDLRMKMITNWFENQESNLIEYPFFNSLSLKLRADFLLIDISYHTFDIIKQEYSSEVQSVRGRFPSSLATGAVFALHPGKDPVEFSVEDSEVFSYIRRVAGKKKVVTQVERIEGDFKTAARTEEGRAKLINELIKKEKLATEAQRLDADDQQLYSVIYNMFDIGNTEPKEISIKQLTKALGKPLRDKSYRDVLNQVHKLSTFRVQHLEVDDTSVRFSDPEFFNATYEIKHAKKATNKEGVKHDAVSLVQEGKRMSIVDVIDKMNESIEDEDMKYSYSSVVISLEPSSYTKRQLMDSTDQIWLISTFEEALSTSTKTVYRLLQAKRVELARSNGAGEKLGTTLSFGFFVEHLQLGDIRKNRLEKQLTHHLDELTGENRLLQSFSLETKNKLVHLVFNPLTQSELGLYRLSPDTKEG